VQNLFETVEQAAINGYPSDFKNETKKIRSFGEGEEFIDNYCRSKGIELERGIYSEKVNRV